MSGALSAGSLVVGMQSEPPRCLLLLCDTEVQNPDGKVTLGASQIVSLSHRSVQLRGHGHTPLEPPSHAFHDPLSDALPDALHFPPRSAGRIVENAVVEANSLAALRALARRALAPQALAQRMLTPQGLMQRGLTPHGLPLRALMPRLLPRPRPLMLHAVN